MRASPPLHTTSVFTARRLFSPYKEPAVAWTPGAIPRAAHTLAMLLLLLTPTASEPSAGFDVVVDDASPCARVDGPGSGAWADGWTMHLVLDRPYHKLTMELPGDTMVVDKVTGAATEFVVAADGKVVVHGAKSLTSQTRDWRERRAPHAAIQRDVRPVDGTTSLGR